MGLPSAADFTRLGGCWLVEVVVGEGFAGNVVVGVDHVAGEDGEALEDGGLDFVGDAGFVPGFAHEAEPAAGGAFVDDEGEVAATEAGVAVSVAVGGGASEPLFEKPGELLLAGFEVFGVEGAEDVVGLDASVEGFDDTGDGGRAADLLVGGGGG